MEIREIGSWWWDRRARCSFFRLNAEDMSLDLRRIFCTVWWRRARTVIFVKWYRVFRGASLILVLVYKIYVQPFTVELGRSNISTRASYNKIVTGSSGLLWMDILSGSIVVWGIYDFKNRKYIELSHSTFFLLSVGAFKFSVVTVGGSLLADWGIVVLCPAGTMLIGHSKGSTVWYCSSKISDFMLVWGVWGSKDEVDGSWKLRLSKIRRSLIMSFRERHPRSTRNRQCRMYPTEWTWIHHLLNIRC